MKAAIVCSSKTGNTMKVAQAIHAAMPAGTDLFAVEEAAAADGYDLIVMGFWVDRGMPDEKAKQYMKTIVGKKVFTFFTLGADPDSNHAKECMAKCCEFYGADCSEIGNFLCQGAIDPKLIEVMKKMTDGPHAPTPESLARWARAASHPNTADYEAAAAAISAALAN